MEDLPGMSAPRVTVLTSVFNGGAYLEQAIAAIHRQSFTDFEFLLIDDASTDATPAMLAEWACRDPRIRVVRNDSNLGLTRSLNKGIRLARGPWIARQDADDWSLPERLERQLAYLDSYPEVGVLGTAAWWVDAQGNPEPKPRVQPVEHAEIRWQLLCTNPFFHTSVMFARELALACPYDESWRFGQDFDLWGRLLTRTRGGNLAEPLVCCRRHEGRVSAVHFQRQQGMALEIARGRCRGLCPGYDWNGERIAAVRGLTVSEWPSGEESLEDMRLWLGLFRAFGQQEGLDPQAMERLKRRGGPAESRATVGSWESS
ncbi:MAG: glycosyltransferase family 2 protein, partial [Magnetococcales bacterium]|nr:glycosyltransferase family 2 protein [Magnetococcales bacterium]